MGTLPKSRARPPVGLTGPDRSGCQAPTRPIRRQRWHLAKTVAARRATTGGRVAALCTFGAERDTTNCLRLLRKACREPRCDRDRGGPEQAASGTVESDDRRGPSERKRIGLLQGDGLPVSWFISRVSFAAQSGPRPRNDPVLTLKHMKEPNEREIRSGPPGLANQGRGHTV